MLNFVFVSVWGGGEAAYAVKRYTGLYTGPYFDTSTPKNITTQLGTTAYLPCKVKQLGNKSVSWIRRRDAHILTVDRFTFIADARFQVSKNFIYYYTKTESQLFFVGFSMPPL